jgi:hypothetical protein
MSSSSGRGEHLPEAGFCAQDKPMVVELGHRASAVLDKDLIAEVVARETTW